MQYQYIVNLVNARNALEKGEIYEATRLMSEAAAQVEELGPKYQRGIDAVGACHSRLERVIGEMDDIHKRMLEEVVPRWQQVVENENKVEANPELDLTNAPIQQMESKAFEELSRLAISLSSLGVPEQDEDGNILALDQRILLAVTSAAGGDRRVMRQGLIALAVRGTKQPAEHVPEPGEAKQAGRASPRTEFVPDPDLFEIFVEGNPYEVVPDAVGGEITYEHVISLENLDPEITYSVIYKKGHEDKSEGILSPDTSVKVKEGMHFSVSETGNS